MNRDVLNESFNQIIEEFIEQYKEKNISREVIDSYLNGSKDGFVVALSLLTSEIKEPSDELNKQDPYSTFVYNQTIIESANSISDNIKIINKNFDILIERLDKEEANKKLVEMMKQWSEESAEIEEEEPEEK